MKAEKFDEKTVIHDYGFGGAGMSLAWGCGVMAAGLALEHNDRKAAVLGCGSPGLTAARQLQRRGFEVTILCCDRAPRHHLEHVLGWFHARHCADQQRAAHAGLGRPIPASGRDFLPAMQLLAGAPGWGVYWIDSYNATDDPNGPRPQAG